MNPAYPSLPAVSWELALFVFLAILFVVILIVGGALRLATTWVAGFTPPWGRTCGAILCAVLLGIIGGMVVARVSMSFLLIIPIGLFLDALSYKAVLPGEDTAEEISMVQAVLICLVQRLIFMVPLALIALGLILFIGVGQMQQILAKQGLGDLSPSGATTRSAPAYRTVADAQKEAVRRYPQLGIQGSRLNKAYVERYYLYQKTRPSYFADNSWPVRLADETANEIAAW